MRGMGPRGALADAGRSAGVRYPSRRAAADVREEERLHRIQARMAAETTRTAAPVRHRPKSYTVFAAAFIAGAAAAVGVNRVLDVQLAQRRPQVECEPIFVALRPLAQGAPVTVWDVALKDWPKAMLPSSALRAGDTFEGYVLRHPVREGQPLLAVQLVRSGAATAVSTIATETFTPAVPAAPTAPPSTSTQADPWMPAESMGQPAPAGAPAPATPVAKVSPATTPPATAAAKPKTVPEAVAVPQATASNSAIAKPAGSDDVATESVSAVRESTAHDAVASAPVAAEPVVAEVAEPARVEPTPVEPVPAPTLASTTQPMPPSPTDIDPPARAQPTPRAESDLDEMNEAVATDVQSMPSVMKSNGQPSAPSTRPAKGDAGRYLVVPERIALQADTSFTTPRPQPPGPPGAATAAAGAAQRSAAQASQSSTRRGTQPRPQTARGQQAQQQAQKQAQKKTQPQPAARDQKQAAAPQRSWGGMFPNVAAGIEAMGSPWQRTRPTAEQDTPAPQPTRR